MSVQPESTTLEAGAQPAEKPRNIWRRWVMDPIVKQLTQGTEPGKISQAIAYGITISIFPVFGTNTLISVLVGIPLKLNQPILQAFRSLAIPLQWVTILGFYRLGEKLFQANPVSLHIPTMMKEFAEAPLPFFAKYGMTALYGVAVWFLIAPVLILLLHAITKPLIKSVAKRLSTKHHA